MQIQRTIDWLVVFTDLAADFADELERTDEDARIDTVSAALGELSRSGPFLRLSVVVRM